MSLLLDALKKAADDKQKAAQPGSDAVKRVNVDTADSKRERVADVNASSHVAEKLSLQAIEESQDNSEKSTIDVPGSAHELTLESEDATASPGADHFDSNELVLDDLDSTDDYSGTKKSDGSYQRQRQEEKELNADRFTVSDDALSLLINKTNREVKRDRKILYISVFIATTAVIVFAGIYYYYDMQAEIAALERRHQIEMLSMQSKTSKEKTPEKSAIISNLVSDANLDDKVLYAKKIAKVQSTVKAVPKVNKEIAKNSANADLSAGIISVRKTKKTDPVGEKLDTAWQEYEQGQYNEAELLYKQVLKIESNNRDALLGLGAIAVIEKDKARARDIYRSLLKLDPRDPIATAALAGMQTDEASLDTDETYMLSMQQKNPEAPHLNFALANIYAQQGKWKLAQQYYFSAWQQDSENADYIYNLAVSMDQLNKQQQALNFYQDCLTKSTNKQVSFSREAVENRIKELSGL